MNLAAASDGGHYTLRKPREPQASRSCNGTIKIGDGTPRAQRD